MLSLKVSVYTHTLLGRHDIRKFTNLKVTERSLRNKKTRLEAGFFKASVNYLACSFVALLHKS